MFSSVVGSKSERDWSLSRLYLVCHRVTTCNTNFLPPSGYTTGPKGSPYPLATESTKTPLHRTRKWNAAERYTQIYDVHCWLTGQEELCITRFLLCIGISIHRGLQKCKSSQSETPQEQLYINNAITVIQHYVDQIEDLLGTLYYYSNKTY